MDNRTFKNLQSLILRGKLSESELLFVQVLIENGYGDQFWPRYRFMPYGHQWPYRIPFYFPAAKVAVYVDTDQSRIDKAYNVFREYGIMIHRIKGKMLANDPERVLKILANKLARKVSEPLPVSQLIIL